MTFVKCDAKSLQPGHGSADRRQSDWKASNADGVTDTEDAQRGDLPQGLGGLGRWQAPRQRDSQGHRPGTSGKDPRTRLAHHFWIWPDEQGRLVGDEAGKGDILSSEES